MSSGARLALVVMLLVAAGGCGGSGEQEATVQDRPSACDVRGSLGFCYEFTGAGWNDMTAQSACESAPDAVFLADGCPESDRVALCTVPSLEDEGREIVYVYYEGADVAEARSQCAGEFEDVR